MNFRGYFNYWGKTAEDGRYHLLPYHCLDVAAVGWKILEPDAPLSKLLTAGLGVSTDFLRRWLAFCLCLHDIGKFSTAFQGLKINLSLSLVPKIESMPYSERHDSLGFLLWCDVISKRWLDCNDSTGVAFSRKQLRSIDSWMRITTGHHGIPPKEHAGRHQDFFTAFDEESAWLYCREISNLFLTQHDLSILEDKDFNKRVKRYSWILAGITVLADWLGSSLHSLDYRAEDMPLDLYWRDHAIPLADRILAEAKFDNSEITPFAGIKNIFPFIEHPTPLQEWAANAELSEEPQLFFLEDVTGAGKTEAAIILLHRLLTAGVADGVYIGLPTMATANAMYSRLAKAYRCLFTEHSKPSLVLAHGARYLSSQFTDSVGLVRANSDKQYDDGEGTGSAYCNSWFADSRKKALLAEVGVGTLDQALLAVLPARHQSLRLLGLSRKVLLIDEVHAYDPYMNQLLQTLLQAHAANGGSAILLSATLPQQMREIYTQSFFAGIDIGSNAPVLIKNPPYPLTTQLSPTGAKEEHIATRQGIERSVAVSWLNNKEAVIELIRQKVEHGQCVCWIRNTVGDAREAYNMLADCDWLNSDRLMLFHSRFAMLDRQRIENKTIEYFGDKSTSEQRHGRVLIATQVVEQSLDLDFDVLISDLAPIDLLIQRAGREHRHIRDILGNRLRAISAVDQRDNPILYILAPEPENDPECNWLKLVLPGTQAVYRHVGQLWLTQQVLLEQQSITPAINARQLIEGVYGDEAQEQIPDALCDLSWDAEGDAGSKRGIARLNQLQLSQGYSRRSAENSGGWDEDVNIPTRLSDQTISVALAVVAGETFSPYAGDTNFAWDMSTINLPKYDWEKVWNMVPQKWQLAVAELREKEPALKWTEVLPLVDEVAPCYDKNDGWSLNTEERNESDK